MLEIQNGSTVWKNNIIYFKKINQMQCSYKILVVLIYTMDFSYTSQFYGIISFT